MVAAKATAIVVRRKERTVEELYNATKIIYEPEITPVLRGIYCMQGPVDEMDQSIQKNMVPPKTVKKLIRRYMSQKVPTKAESGTCNVCSAPCSSCVHLSIDQMGSKSDEFSDETDRVAVASQHSINEDKTGDSLQHSPSEASNLLSVNSSHDSYSENIESKATVRPSDISDASEDVGIQRTFSNKYDGSKGVEGPDDNISCASRASDANAAFSYCNKDLDSKNSSHSSASVCSLGAGKVTSSQKLDLSELPSIKEADVGSSSMRIQSPYSRSRSGKNSVGGSSEISPKIHQKSEADIENNSGDLLDNADKNLKEDEQDELVKLPNKQESPLQTVSGDESYESDDTEHDVKVCDICGDAGREDLLAICSKCTDGAEHTYCMREMLQKIPEGDWLCEECKLAEEIESQKQGLDAEGKKANKLSSSTQSLGKRHAENLQGASASKRQAVETNMGSPKSLSPSRVSALSREGSFKNLDKGKVRPSPLLSLGNHSVNDMPETAENLEGASASKRQAVETNMGSPKSLSPSRVSALSREGSFKNLDKGKVRPSPPLSLGNHSVNDTPETVRSPTSGPRLQTSKGTLLKSNSFNTLNSKPKVKLVDDVVLQKQKSGREHASLDSKEEPARMMGKSMSFKSGNSRWLNAGESKFKMLSSKYPHVQDLKGLKQVKERISLERKNFSKLDRSSSTVSTPKIDQKLAPRADTISHSYAINNRETKVVQSDGKPSTLSRSTTNLARKGVENAVTSAVGVSSTNGRISSEQKLNQVSLKEEPASSSSWVVERQPSNFNGVMSDVQSQSLDLTNQSEKSRESAVNRSSKSVPCLKCKEMGHTAEYCSVSQAAVADLSAPRTSREEINKGNKLKAANEPAIHLKPGICERTSQDPLSISSKAKNMISVEITNEGQTNICNQASIGNMKLLNSHSTDAVSVVSSVGNLSTRDESFSPLATLSAASKMSAIPEHEYVWQGAFDVHKTGKPPEFCGGIQAHLSTLASPKVLEVVNTFPHKVSLNEVPRSSTWPTQFHETGPKEDNIALYFFAKDLESYEKNYKILLDTMVKNDFALKGNFEGVELLIFPSNQLPENCQRWNALLFLWGVFKGRRANCSNSSNSAACIPDASTVRLRRDISTDIPQLVDNESAACDSSCNVVPVNTAVEKTCISTDRIGDNKVPFFEQTYVRIKEKLEEQDGKIDTKFLSRIATSSAQVHPEMKCISSSQEESTVPESRMDTQLKPCLQATETSSGSFKVVKEEMRLGEDYQSSKDLPTGKQEAVVVGKIDGDSAKVKDSKDDRYGDGKTHSKRDIDCRQSNHRKRPCLDLTETVSEISTDTSQNMPWSEVRGSVDGVSDNKKLKTGFSGIYQNSSARDQGPFSDSLASDRHDMGSGCSLEVKICDIACEEKVIPEDMGSSERFFFPVDSRHAGEFRLGDNSKPWKELYVKHEDPVQDASPNLELALGAETRSPNKGILPFFLGPLDKNDKQDRPQSKVKGKQQEDDFSASLSLSLAFPFPEKERNVKSVSKTEELLPERHPVNTSLLLFGGFPEK